jgi:hypothetical protein
MSRITSIDRSVLRDLQQQILDALKGIEKSTGVKFSFGAGRYMEDNATLKLIVSTVSKGGEVNSPDKSLFEVYASSHGLKSTDFGREFTYGGQKYKLVGYKPKSYRFPFIGEKVSTGKRFKFPESVIVGGLGGR